MPKVLIVTSFPEDHVAPLRGVAELIWGPKDGSFTPRAEILRMGDRIDAILCYAELAADRELLTAMPRLRIVANASIGYDNLDPKTLDEFGVWGSNTPDTYTLATADATFGLLLSVARKVALGDRFVRTGQWKDFAPNRWEGTLLAGKTLGIVGYGDIGKAVRKRAEAFGMNVIFHKRTPIDDPACRANLDDLLRESDFVSLHTPLTPQTNKLINARNLALIKPGAVLINMARGKVVDEQAMVDALRSGRLGGAGLDVFENEPRVHPDLMTMDNVTLAPHTGGATRESRRNARTLAAENIARVLRGERPRTPINNPPSPRG